MEAITNEYTSLERKPVIDEGLRDLLPSLSDEAYEALTLDILQNGCYSPMICMEDMTLVDGHNRYAICEENDIPYRMVVLPFEDKLAAKQWALDTQKARRNLTTWELGQIALKLKPEIEARAEARLHLATGGDRKSEDFKADGSNQGLATLPNLDREAVNTRKELADAAGIGERTMGKIMKIEEEAPAPIKEAVESSDISIHKGYDITKKLRDVPEEERDAAALVLLEEAHKKDMAEIDRTSGIAKHINKIFELISTIEITEENVWHWIEWTGSRRPELEVLLMDTAEAIEKITQIQDLLLKIQSEDWRNPYDEKISFLDALDAAPEEGDSAESADGDTGDIAKGEPDQQYGDGSDPEEA
ncbi:hypothetical protein LJC27_05075 [Christensenellaceae bacterium OttesenSCG-928-M15]|nr:hypothetical protein [Christensenellaceae bacterium OttesenSCG-928-M15]